MAGEPDTGRKSRGWNVVLLEVAAIASVGLAFSLMANLVSPRGLALGRDYLPGKTGAAPVVGLGSGTNGSGTPSGTNPPGPPELATVASRLAEKGLRVIDGPEA